MAMPDVRRYPLKRCLIKYFYISIFSFTAKGACVVYKKQWRNFEKNTLFDSEKNVLFHISDQIKVCKSGIAIFAYRLSK